MGEEALPDAGFVYTTRWSNGPHDQSYCCAAVHDGYGVGHHQCTRKPKVWRDVLHRGKPTNYGYCTTHDPVRVAERDAARRAKWQAESDARNARWAAQEQERKLKDAALATIRQIAAGHNDPRSLAMEVLATFDAAPDAPNA